MQEKDSHIHVYKVKDYTAAKKLYKLAVEHQAFFRWVIYYPCGEVWDSTTYTIWGEKGVTGNTMLSLGEL